MPFTLDPLPYPYEALEPHIDAATMKLHHDKHHQTYVDNLNKALDPYPDLAGKSIEDLLRGFDQIPAAVQGPVKNNGGGHANHTMFWKIMRPTGGSTEPTGPVADALNSTFGSFTDFKTKFEEAGTKQFGSGWVFVLVEPGTGKLELISKPNQDSPLMDGKHVLMGNDVWEHAYYLKYNNRRAEYLKAWWNTVNWDAVAERYSSHKG